MCKEDIRIGVKKTYRQVGPGPAQGQVAKVLSARGDRLAVIVAAPAAEFGGNSESMVIGTQLAGAVVPFGVIGTFNQSIYFGVEQYGELITGEIWIHNDTTGPNGPFVTEVFFTQALEDV